MRARAQVFGRLPHARRERVVGVQRLRRAGGTAGAEEKIKKATRKEQTVSTAAAWSQRAVSRISERTQIFAYDPRRADAWKRGGLITPPTWAVL
jgi:hypothetical protein